MSASQRGKGLRQALKPFMNFTVSAFGPLIGEVGIKLAEMTARRAARRRTLDLQTLNSHTLRDIGLMRDRFTGTLRNDLSGEILDHQVRQAEDPAQTAAYGFDSARLSGIERRRGGRRVSDRRFAVRRRDAALQEQNSMQSAATRDRRAFNRRASDCKVLDGREAFRGRPRPLLA